VEGAVYNQHVRRARDDMAGKYFKYKHWDEMSPEERELPPPKPEYKQNPPRITNDAARYILHNTFNLQFDELQFSTQEIVRNDLSDLLAFGTYRPLSSDIETFEKECKGNILLRLMDDRMSLMEWHTDLLQYLFEYNYNRHLDEEAARKEEEACKIKTKLR
jgi:hypothetical protein